MSRFWFLYVTLAVIVSVSAAAYVYFFTTGEFDEKPMAEADIVWMPNRFESVALADTAFSRAEADAARLREQFLRGNHAEVESTIAQARSRGYTPWYLGSWQAFYFRNLRDDPGAASEGTDIERARNWIENSSNSTYAHAYLCDLYSGLGWNARGTDLAAKTPAESFAEMRRLFGLAIAACEQALEIDPGNVYASYLLITMSRTSRLGIDRDRIFEAAVEHDPDYFHLYRGYQEDLQPRWGGSNQELFEFARRYAGGSSPYPALSGLIIEAHNDRAAQLAEQRSRFDPPVAGRNYDTELYWKQYYKYFRDEAVWQEYRRAFETIIAAFPEYADRIYEFASVAEGSGRKETAMRYYEQAMQADPFYLGADKAYEYAGKLRALNYNAQANKYYRLYLELAPDLVDSSRAHAAADFVAWQYSTEGKFKESFPYYKMVVELTPDSARSLANYCNALFNIHEYDEGIRYCNDAIDVDPDHSWSYYILAEIYKRKGDAERSRHYQDLYSTMTRQ